MKKDSSRPRTEIGSADVSTPTVTRTRRAWRVCAPARLAPPTPAARESHAPVRLLKNSQGSSLSAWGLPIVQNNYSYPWSASRRPFAPSPPPPPAPRSRPPPPPRPRAPQARLATRKSPVAFRKGLFQSDAGFVWPSAQTREAWFPLGCLGCLGVMTHQQSRRSRHPGL